MINPDAAVFPNNVVLVLDQHFKTLDEEVHVEKRPLRGTDPNVCVGIFASQWVPDEDSHEMSGAVLGGGGMAAWQEPTLQEYIISVQALVKDMDEIRGLSKHSVLAKMCRDMLLRNPTVGVALTSLSVTDSSGVTERLKRRRVRTQRYVSNEITGTWLYLATIEFMIETETV